MDRKFFFTCLFSPPSFYIPILSFFINSGTDKVQARTQAFEKGVQIQGFLQIRGVNSVSGEKLHDFAIIWPARAPLPTTYGPEVGMWW